MVPTEVELRWASDRSGHRRVIWGRPWAPDPPGRLPVTEGQIEREETYPAGHLAVMFPDPPPADPDRLLTYLSRGHPIADQGSPELIVAIVDLRMEWRTSPAVDAAILELLRRTGDLRLAGATTDRLGRPGSAYTIDHDHGGLPTRTTVVIGAAGQVSDVEDTLTTTPGKLNVTIPATIGYTAFR